MSATIYKRDLVMDGFRSLKTVAVFWSPERKPSIVETANEFSIENNVRYDWMDHDNVFAIVHVDTGLLGYYHMKRIVTDDSAGSALDNGKVFIGLDFVNHATGDKLFVPVHQMRTLMFPDGGYFIMAVPVGHVIVAFKGFLTLKMWF